jgi:hypothetical protein
MRKKIKNKDLEGVLENSRHLGTYPMPGELTLAVIASRRALRSVFEIYKEASKQVGEARCERDEQGNPVTEFQKDENGLELTGLPRKLKFKTPEMEKETLKELMILGDREAEFDAKEFDRSTIEKLNNITPIQMEAICSLVDFRS